MENVFLLLENGKKIFQRTFQLNSISFLTNPSISNDVALHVEEAESTLGIFQNTSKESSINTL